MHLGVVFGQYQIQRILGTVFELFAYPNLFLLVRDQGSDMVLVVVLAVYVHWLHTVD